MGEPDRLSLELLKLGYTAVDDAFSGERERWKALDTKAQATAAVGGIFIAAVFAWVRDLPSDFSQAHAWLLTGTVMAVTLGVGFAVWAMRIRWQQTPIRGEDRATAITDFLTPPVGQNLVELFNTMMPRDPGRLMALRNTNDGKALWVERAQWCLLVAAALAGALVIVRLFPLL